MRKDYAIITNLSSGSNSFVPDEKMRARLKEELVQKALDQGASIKEIEKMYNVTFVKIPKTNENKHSYSETTHYGNDCKITITVIEYGK